MPRENRWTELAQTLQKVRVPSLIVTREGVVTWENDAAADAFGGDLRNKSFFSIVAPEDVPVARREFERKLRRGVPVTDYTVDLVTRDGSRRRAEISSVRLPGGDRCHAVFGVAVLGRPRPPASRNPRLTPRQNEVLQMLGNGMSTEQIAAMLHLSIETVRNHIRHVLQGLGAHSRLEAVAIARREGLLQDR